MNLLEFKAVFDPCLKKTLASRIEESLRDKGDISFAEFWRYSNKLAETGKRLRPYLAYLGYSACGGSDVEEIMGTAVGLELFHLFCLIHDDIMDQDLERRGLATTHTYIFESLKGKVLEEHRVRIAESIAMLIGDDMFAWSRELLADPRLAERLRYMIDEVILGQVLDVLLTGSKTASRKELNHMMLLKTAGYSFARPLQIGGALAGMDELRAGFFDNFGKTLGLAFQLQDDYFDRKSDVDLDRPTYYSRGYESQGLAMCKEKFEEAEKILNASDLSDSSKKLFAEVLIKIRDRKE